jgi:hypothetical protein
MLQRLNIVHLQDDLAKKKKNVMEKMAASPAERNELKVLLHDYSK